MIIVTGAAGFIGSNLLRGLNAQGRRDIIAVDDLSDGGKFSNLLECDFLDYLDKEEFMANLSTRLDGAEQVFHQGACTDTREQDGRFMLENNYAWSRRLLDECLRADVPLVYASSAAVYGNNRRFTEQPQYERPVNVYGYSKLLFDRYVRRVTRQARTQVVGLRYFNVYGPGEGHKGAMASMIFQLHKQLLQSGAMKLFKGSGGYADGEQRRDFIYVADVVDVNLWFMQNREVSGIFNVGAGNSRSFNDIARLLTDRHAGGRLEYVDFPADLPAAYQSFTEADISALRRAGYDKPFTSLEQGVGQYLGDINHQNTHDTGTAPHDTGTAPHDTGTDLNLSPESSASREQCPEAPEPQG